MTSIPDRQKDLDVGAVFVVAAVGTILVVLSVLLLQAYYYKTEDAAIQQAHSEPLLDVKRAKAVQLQLLTGAGQVPPEPGKGTMRIPIERAIEIVARDGARAWPAPPPGAAPAAGTASAPGSAPGAGQSGATVAPAAQPSAAAPGAH